MKNAYDTDATFRLISMLLNLAEFPSALTRNDYDLLLERDPSFIKYYEEETTDALTGVLRYGLVNLEAILRYQS